MPLRRGRAKARPTSDPLTACLDANGTYICTSFNPRCYIIQKVTTTQPQSSSAIETVEFKREEDSHSSTNSNPTHELRQPESSSDGMFLYATRPICCTEKYFFITMH
ncbi:uncharacterized protein LOC123672858 [Harmonia axyridis]|uniref:uncharacterized protein LOC123672858 n=1 Tax=Harmonia axyridis TaxID=115357 RepID=UPI001E2788B0|nr:uncharacterized protein LOC123672858 [Harmonia axyridis]